jgi:tRNA(Ile)-lysidine synthase
MLQRFSSYILEHNLISPGDKILLAVSGGIDSIVMADLFIRSGITAGIAHCNFSLRGKESDLDEELVSSFAQKYRIPFYATRFSTYDYAHQKGISVQMAARELRYEWFEKIRSENNFNSIAVAHNSNDNAETLILNLTRGTGISGLTGMKPVSGVIIRPLLFASRDEITAYCTDNNLTFREDRSNADTKYTRNKIRLKIIPILSEINPAITDTLNETAARLSGVNEIVAAYIEGLRRELIVTVGDQQIVAVDALNKFTENKTIIYELFRPYGITDGTLNDLLQILNGRTGSEIVTPGYRIIKNRNELIITALTAKLSASYGINSPEDLYTVPGINEVNLEKITPGFLFPSEKTEICLDADKLEFPLLVRQWQAGDSFFPLGMSGKKKLSDFFTDRKYSVTDKENALVLISGGQIAGILGERIDNRFRITESSARVLRIRFSPMQA